MVEMRAFTKEDWDCFAGCDGENPTIGEQIDVIEKPELDGLVVADECSVQIHLSDDDGEFVGFWSLEVKGQALATLIASGLPSRVTEAQLVELGFRYTMM